MHKSANRFPLSPADLADIKDAASRFILPGYAPPAPFIVPHPAIVAMGSCFAEHIAKAITSTGTKVRLLRIEEAGNTPLATERVLTDILAAHAGARGAGLLSGIEDLPLAEIAADMKTAPLMVLTLGVALQMFSDGAPVFAFTKETAARLSFKMLTPGQIRDAVKSIIRLVRGENPTIHIVLTLSPIPLKMSPNHPSVFGQDCLSKSLLRAVIEEILNDGTANVSYWPSFEIVRWLGAHAGPFFGVEGVDNRHIPARVLDTIMDLFIERHFLPVH